MKIPKSLKVSGFTYQVVKDKNVSHEGNAFGSTHLATQRIFIEPDLSKQKEEQTLIHEILHAIWFSSGLAKNKEFTNDKEELIVDALSHGLYQVLTDNNLLK